MRTTLPESLKAILYKINCGALTAADENGVVHVFVKAPHQEVKLLKGDLLLRHFLFLCEMPTAPVVGWFFEILDNPQDPLRVDNYFNVCNPLHAKDMERLACQDFIPVHFVDEQDISIVATKRISPPNDIIDVYMKAINLAFFISEGVYDFDKAKAAFQAEHSLDEIATWQPSPWENK